MVLLMLLTAAAIGYRWYKHEAELYRNVQSDGQDVAEAEDETIWPPPPTRRDQRNIEAK